MEHQLRLKRGENELACAGDREFVEAMAARFGPWILGMAPLSVRVESQPEPEMAGTAGDLDRFPRVSPQFKPRRNLDLPAFVAMKEAVLPEDLVVVAAYYFEKYLEKDAYTAGELADALQSVPRWEGGDIDEVLSLVVARGHLDPARDSRYTLTYKGQIYVREGLS